MTFDTFKFAKRLEASGISREHAAGITEVLVEVSGQQADGLATKEDIMRLDNAISGLKSDLKELELRMTIKFGAMAVAMGGIIGGIIITAMRFMLVKGV